MYNIAKNEQFKSIEITFDGKPSEKIREALKSLRFRWHGVRGVWYGYTDEQTARAAIENAENSAETSQKQPKKSAKLPSLWERTRTDDLPRYGTANALNGEARENARKNGSGYDKEAAKIMRRILKERFPECKISVTSGGAGYLNSVDIRIKATPYAREFIKGDGKWDSPNQYNHYENSPELKAVLNFCNALRDAFDNDDGDVYADYGAYHDLYGRAEIDYQYSQTEPTEEQKVDAEAFSAAKKADDERKAAEAHERFLQEEKEREEAARAYEIQQAEENKTAAEIVAHIQIVDLAEAEQIAVVDLMEAYGKENTLKEVDEHIEERTAEAVQKGRDVSELLSDAIISRKVLFTSRDLFNKFSEMFMRDFEFISGTGGTGCNDIRLNSWEEYSRLNEEQRRTVHTYASNCIGVYLDNVLQYIIDAQGYSYSRYILRPIGEARTDGEGAAEYLKKWEEASKEEKPFYIPLPIAEQTKTANLQPGEQFTAIVMNGWICSAQAICGTIEAVTPCKWAQYENAVKIEYISSGKRKAETIYLHNGQDAVIYRGMLPAIPESLLYTETGTQGMRRVNYAGSSADGFIRKAIEYYEALGCKPLIDTVQR